MRDQRTVRLVIDRAAGEAAAGKSKRQRKRSRTETQSWEGVDRELFEKLREMRRTLADERGVPAFMIFADSTLRELARIRPLTPEQMLQVAGVGQTKLRDFGEAVLALIAEYRRASGSVTG
jgi:ATP-dependent DNA helicase RecQ